MAFAPVQEVLIQPQSLGEVFIAARDLPGPASYVNGTGQKISANAFALLSMRLAHATAIDSTGTWYAQIQWPGPGAQTYFYARWYVLATGAEVGNGVNLSGGKIRFAAIGN